MRISRDIENWGWYRDSNTFRVFFHLLLRAQSQDSEYMGVKILRGQVATGRKQLSADLGISEQGIRTAIDHLIKSGEINQQSTNKFSVITICKFDNWQCLTKSDNQQINQQLTNNQPTTNHNIRNKEYKNIIPPPTPNVRAYACACERKPVEEYLTEVLMDDSWVEATCMNHRIDRFTLVKMSEDFKTECKCNGKETADSLQDAKHHFNSWLRIRLEAERKQEKEVQHGQQTTNGESQAERVARLWLK